MAMIEIIKVIDAAENVEDVFNPKINPECFDIDKDSLIRRNRRSGVWESLCSLPVIET